MLRRLVVIGCGALLVAGGAPAGARAATDPRATPTVTVAVTPRYPQPGHTARLTIRVAGTHGPAAGWVRVRFDGAVIAGCAHLTLHKGTTACTAPRTWAAKRTFVVGYKGSPVYRPRAVTRIAWS